MTIRIKQLFESYRLSGRAKMWKLDLFAYRKLESLIYDMVRESKKEFYLRLEDLGIINLKGLNLREQKIIRERFFEFKTYKEIGKEFGVTMERIRQIEARGLEKLRNISVEPTGK